MTLNMPAGGGKIFSPDNPRATFDTHSINPTLNPKLIPAGEGKMFSPIFDPKPQIWYT